MTKKSAAVRTRGFDYLQQYFCVLVLESVLKVCGIHDVLGAVLVMLVLKACAGKVAYDSTVQLCVIGLL